MRKPVYLFVLVMLVSGCATTVKYEAKLNTWMGVSEESLIAAWGVPDKEYRMSDGTKAIAYIHKDTIQTGGYAYTMPQTTHQTGTIGNQTYSGTTTTYVTATEPVQRYKIFCKTSFIIDKSGKVKSWHHQGNNCVSR